jgi:hypothetical protein
MNVQHLVFTCYCAMVRTNTRNALRYYLYVLQCSALHNSMLHAWFDTHEEAAFKYHTGMHVKHAVAFPHECMNVPR